MKGRRFVGRAHYCAAYAGGFETGRCSTQVLGLCIAWHGCRE